MCSEETTTSPIISIKKTTTKPRRKERTPTQRRKVAQVVKDDDDDRVVEKLSEKKLDPKLVINIQNCAMHFVTEIETARTKCSVWIQLATPMMSSNGSTIIVAATTTREIDYWENCLAVNEAIHGDVFREMYMSSSRILEAVDKMPRCDYKDCVSFIAILGSSRDYPIANAPQSLEKLRTSIAAAISGIISALSGGTDTNKRSLCAMMIAEDSCVVVQFCALPLFAIKLDAISVSNITTLLTSPPEEERDDDDDGSSSSEATYLVMKVSINVL